MRILIVEDDPSIRFGLTEFLNAEGYDTESCERGDACVEEKVAAFAPRLILLDVMLPGRSGYDCCRDLRAAGIRVPVIMLTARGQEQDKITGLECGADDYVTKPFALKELAARIHALLRRAHEFNTAPATDSVCFTVGSCHVNPADFSLTDNNETRTLTPRECALLAYLHRHRGKVLSREQLLADIWGLTSAAVSTRTLDQTVAQVRRKLGESATTPRFLVTIHGIGYKLQPENGIWSD